MRNRMLVFRLLYLGLLLVVLGACSRSDVAEIQLQKKVSTSSSASSGTEVPLRIGMGAMITPKEGYIFYRQLKDYLEVRLGRKVVLVDRGSYEEMNQLLGSGGVELAFICAGPYVEAHEKDGVEIIAMPLVKGKPSYHSYIIVPKDSPAKSLMDLKGKSFAFTDPKSNTGKLIPTYLLARQGKRPETFFASTTYTYGHDKSIMAVAEKLADGAAVDSLIWEYMQQKQPAVTARVKVIDRSDPYGIPPVVARRGVPADTVKKVQQILFTMHKDVEGRKILAGMMTDRFVPGDDSNYDSIREINRWLVSGSKSGRN